MADYQSMYIKLFNKVTDVILELQQVQRDTEQQFVESNEENLLVIDVKDNEKS